MSTTLKNIALVTVIMTAVTFLVSCDDTGVASNNSPYYVTFHLGAPVDKNYSKSLVECASVPIIDTGTLVTMQVLKFVALGRCDCGALEDQFFMVTDTLLRPVYSPGDSGSLGVRVQSKRSEKYASGNLTVDSASKGLSGYTIHFTGRIKYGSDSVDLTNGIMYSPLRTTP